MKKNRFNFFLSDAQKAALESLAKAKDVSVAYLIRQAVEKFLRSSKAKA